MQIDMHYYGTYCLARAAGLAKEAALTIAYSAQFVDDNVAATVHEHDDGSQIYAVPTAHHPADLSNREDDDQRYIWVPFHFIPGVQGTAFTEKLICTKDSIPAREMIANHVSKGDSPYGLELLGIGTHVYQDTFAHYGFSGVSSRRNRVIGDSFVLTQDEATVEAAIGRSFGEWVSQYGGLLKNIRSKISDVGELYSGALGHGGVSTYPDLPFLQWQFTYEQSEETVYHDNQETFFDSARKLYEVFSQFVAFNPQYGGSTSVDWTNIADKIEWLLKQEGIKWDRVELWQSYAQQGIFGEKETIPKYDEEKWNKQAEEIENLDSGADGLELEVHRFFRAASYHVHYILRELLPKHGVMLV